VLLTGSAALVQRQIHSLPSGSTTFHIIATNSLTCDDLVDLLNNYLTDVPVTPVESGQRLQLLQYELIKRRIVRFNTKAYELDQQIASKMLEPENEGVESAQLESYAIQLREEICQLNNKTHVAKLESDLQGIMASNVFVFGLEQLNL